VVAHGVALKPGKPVCLAVTGGKPVVILPGFPTSAVFTFHEFLAPVIRAFAGRPPERREHVDAKLPMRVNSERGRTEYLLVGLVPTDEGLAAYPMGKGSGSVTTFSSADGFITIGQHTEIVDAGAPVQVQLLGHGLDAADLIFIGSHCVGLDWLAGELVRQRLIDELIVYVAPKLLGPQARPLAELEELRDLSAAPGFAILDTCRIGDDVRLRLRPRHEQR